ncbi:MAG: sel1 repeat family protein [Lachnospiraceae bacterium]|nr:sel1 repeat family protein [Lachnospiraceae bacterium]
MTVKEATEIIESTRYYYTPTEEQLFMYTEALEFLISETHDTRAMMEFGGYYYEQRLFDLALKYYEMASSYGDDNADECLGYVLYYGRTGEQDYKKAFEYFSKAMERGNLVATYKIADMYKNGYYVEKDYEKYRNIIEGLYPKIKNARNEYAPLPEIYTRLAKIRVAQGKIEEAVDLYEDAKYFLANRISDNDFFGNLNIMKWLVEDLYKLTDIDEENINLFDLYYLLKKPIKIAFFHDLLEESYEVEAIEEEGEVVIRFGNSWYRDPDDFFQNAAINGDKLTALYPVLSVFTVVK